MESIKSDKDDKILKYDSLLEGIRKTLYVNTFFTAVLVFFIMFLSICSGLNFYYREYAAGLLHSQQHFISYQEWRSVRNGIFSGWSLNHEIDSACLINKETKKILFGECRSTSFYAGGTVEASFQDYHLTIFLKSSMWKTAFVYSVLVTIALYLILHFITKNTIIKFVQIRLIEVIKGEKHNLSALEKLIKAQSDEILGLQKNKAVSDAVRNISHDLKGPIGVMSQCLNMVDLGKNHQVFQSALFRLQTMATSLKDAEVDDIIRDNWGVFSLKRLIDELSLS